MRKLIPYIIAVSVLFGLIKLFRTVQKYDPSIVQNQDNLGDVSILLQNSHIVSTKSGIKDWDIIADRIELKKGMFGGLDSYSSADFKGIRNGKLYRDGKKEADFSAREARYDPQIGNFQISGELTLKTKDGDKLTAPACYWSEHEDVIRLESGMSGTIDGHKITSPYVLFNPKKRFVSCPQGAVATIGGYPLRAILLQWDVPTGLIKCPGTIVGERPNMTFEAHDGEIKLKTNVDKRRPGDPASAVETLRLSRGSIEMRIDPDGDTNGVMQ